MMACHLLILMIFTHGGVYACDDLINPLVDNGNSDGIESSAEISPDANFAETTVPSEKNFLTLGKEGDVMTLPDNSKIRFDKVMSSKNSEAIYHYHGNSSSATIACKEEKACQGHAINGSGAYFILMSSQNDDGEAVLQWTRSERNTIPKTVLQLFDILLHHNNIGKCGFFSILKLVDYGNHCGLGGRGDFIDEIDECCYHHDQCYSKISRELDCSSWQTLFTNHPANVFYSPKYEEGEDNIKCHDLFLINCDFEHSNKCSCRTCECDVAFMECMDQTNKCP